MNNLVKIKFCGMSKKKDIDVAIKLGVDWIGIIYVKTSPRYVGFQKSDAFSLFKPTFLARAERGPTSPA